MLASSISSSASSSYSAHSESSRFTRDFEEIKLLGKGAFGEVYHVKHNLDKKEYAMKIIPANKINQKDLREVLALSDFKHSGIVQYYCSFIDDCAKVAAGWTSYHSRSDTTFSSSRSSSESAMETSLTCGATFIPGGFTKFLFIQMELCSGSLKDWLSENVKRRRSLVLKFFEQILDAVIYIHEKNYMHRDLKPSNILFAMDDKIKVSDFGLVRQVDPRTIDPLNQSPTVNLDGSSSATGTLFYASPEQKNNEPYTRRTDVYSLGIILFELYWPFSTDSEKFKVLNYITGHSKVPQNFQENHNYEARLVELMLKPNDERPSSFDTKEYIRIIKDNAEHDHSFILPQLNL